MKPDISRRLQAMRASVVLVAGTVLSAPLEASPLSRVTLDGLTRAEGIRSWIEITEPGSLGLLCMGIAGLLIGRWAAGRKRGGPPGL
ncbi:hypothetical protein [Blastomonas sp. SL216]|uniref:hypothetical protein n=1 Tax=Blastomonas sp. SL216 TaxID=2995169 RepID=UPI002376D6F4|nr:hypothetical protein OU999_04635 [Blastomonas sp. SL216]